MSSAPDLDKPVLIFEPKELTVTYPTVPCWWIWRSWMTESNLKMMIWWLSHGLIWLFGMDWSHILSFFSTDEIRWVLVAVDRAVRSPKCGETFKKAGSASFLLLFPRHDLGRMYVFKSWRTDTWISEWGFDLPHFVCVVAHASVKHRGHLGCVRCPCLSARCYSIMQMTKHVISTKKPLNVRQSQAFLRGWQSLGKMESSQAAVGDGWKQ